MMTQESSHAGSDSGTLRATTECSSHLESQRDSAGYSTTDEITLRDPTPPLDVPSTTAIDEPNVRKSTISSQFPGSSAYDGSTHRESSLFQSPAADFPLDEESTVGRGGDLPLPEFLPYEKLAQKKPHPLEYPSMTFGPPIIILFDIVVPCIIYYVWYDIHLRQWNRDCRAAGFSRNACPIPQLQYNKDILGYAVISFGFGEVYILVARVLRLFRERDLCAPLLSRSVWELDATSWVYGVAMICALIPFVVGSTLEIPQLYLYGPGFLMAFLGVIMILTLIPIKIPIGINSHARGSQMRPFIYYAAEDFIAVDGLQDREFRVRYNARYDSSPAFRRMFYVLTFWWISGVLIYLGCLSAIIWKLEFHYAFGTSLGVLFAYILLWAGVSYWYVMTDMHRQKVAHQRGKC